MSRRTLLIRMATLCCAAVAAGWFAVNAPEASRPRFADLGPVRLPNEVPPTPPAPIERALIAPGDGAKRLLFAATLAPHEATGAPLEPPPGEHGFRAVLAPIAAAPVADLDPLATPRSPRDDFQAAFGIERPRHSQYFGGHLIPKAMRETDPDASALGPDAESPAYAPIPRPNPRILEEMAGGAGAQGGGEAPLAGEASPAEEGSASAAPEGPASETPDAPAGAEGEGLSAATEAPPVPGPPGSGSAEEGFILLGVLLRQGDDRALIRTASGESRRVSQGDEISGGWRVSEIGEDFIRIRRGSQTREVRVPK